VDGKPVIEVNEDAEPGVSALLGRGPETVAELDLVAGQHYAVELLVRSAPESPMSMAKAGYLPAEQADLMAQAIDAARLADVAVVVVSRTPEWESEGFDMETMALPGRQNELIDAVSQANPNTIVVVNAGAAIAMPWLSSVRSVLQVWYPGEEGAAAIADVIFGASEPGGRLAVSYPARVEDSSGAATYPPVDGELRYSDGLFVGYRHHEAHGIDPVFSFGHGLSYTAFEYGELAVTAAGDSGEVVATVEVSNVGQRAGSEVVQLYVRDVESSQPRPVKELKGFAKIRLAAGERQVARFALDRRAFSRFSSDQHDWIVEPGEFELLAGSSSQNIRARATIHVD
jgi:beta-glucosidase